MPSDTLQHEQVRHVGGQMELGKVEDGPTAGVRSNGQIVGSAMVAIFLASEIAPHQQISGITN